MTFRKLTRRDFLKSVSVGAVSAVGPNILLRTAHAQTAWKPERPIQVVIQFAAGGGTDVVLRTLLKQMEGGIGQRINVTNMPGALGSIATKHVMGQPADGYTWLGLGGFLDYPRIRGIDDAIAWKDFQLYQVASSLASWATHPSSPFKTFQDVIDFAKKNPGKLRVSSDGVGGLWHEAIARVAAKAGFEFTNVPYDGGAPATVAALQREVDIAGSGLHEQIQFVRAGQLRHLATFTPAPVDVGGKLVLESVTKYVPGVAASAPFGGDYCLGLRRETPRHILQAVSTAISAAIASAPFKKMLEDRFIVANVVFGETMDKKAARYETDRAALFQDLKLAKKSAQELGLPSPEGFDKWWPPKDYKPAL